MWFKIWIEVVIIIAIVALVGFINAVMSGKGRDGRYRDS